MLYGECRFAGIPPLVDAIDKEIARELDIAPQTVNSHLKRVFRKLRVNDRRQAAAAARELGIPGVSLSGQ